MGATRTTWWVLVASALVILAAGSEARAQAAAYKALRGKLIVSDSEIPADFTSDKEMVTTLRKLNKKLLTRRGGEQAWRLHFMAFLKSKPGASEVYLVFYKGRGKNREYVTAKPINIDPSVNIVASEIDVSEEDGLVPGTTYEVLVARKVGRKEKVFAETRLTLK